MLSEDIGIHVPRYASAPMIPLKGNGVVYGIQKRLLSGAIGNRLIHNPGHRLGCRALPRSARRDGKDPGFQRPPGPVFRLDSQISNRPLSCDTVPGSLKGGGAELVYIDTSTPLMRGHGVEQLNAEPFL